jgi:hypothetical protein
MSRFERREIVPRHDTKLFTLYEAARQAVKANGAPGQLRLRFSGSCLSSVSLVCADARNGHQPTELPAEAGSDRILVDTSPLRDIPRSPFTEIDFIDLERIGNDEGPFIFGLAVSLTPHANPNSPRTKPLVVSQLKSCPGSDSGRRLHARPLTYEQVDFFLNHLVLPQTSFAQPSLGPLLPQA